MATEETTQTTARMSDEAGATAGWLRRFSGRTFAAARHNPLMAVVLCSGLSIILATVVSAIVFITRVRDAGPEPTLELALDRLDAGQINEARLTATRLQLSGKLSYHQQGGPLYVQGAALAQEAAEHWREDERRKLYLVAARYLEEARDRGFPPDREDQGMYLLSTCLFQSGHYADSLPILQEALAANPQHRHELHRLLAAAYYNDASPQFDQALHYSLETLEDPNLTAAQRHQELLQQARIYLRLGRLAEAKLAPASITADEAIQGQINLTNARILIAEADRLQADGVANPDDGALQPSALYASAIELLQKAQAEDKTGDTIRQSRYLAGICHLRRGDIRAAEQAFSRTRRVHFRTPEALPAALSEAEIQQSQGRYDVALTTYLDALAEVEEVQTYYNPWVSYAELCDRLLAAQKAFREAKQFKEALQLSHGARTVLPIDESLLAEAEGRRSWGEYLTNRAAGERFSISRITLAEARHQFREAGKTYQQLAEQRFATRHFPQDLWESGFCHLQGQSFDRAAETLTRFLEACSRTDRPQGLVALGEAHLATGNLEGALKVLRECIVFFPKHPWSYRARLLASQVWREKGMLPEAKSVLVENLDHESLTPSSKEWIDSQFACGRLLFTEAMNHERDSREFLLGNGSAEKKKEGLVELEKAHDLFQRAIRELEEAVDRAPNHNLAYESNYRIAESWRHSAKFRAGKS